MNERTAVGWIGHFNHIRFSIFHFVALVEIQTSVVIVCSHCDSLINPVWKLLTRELPQALGLCINTPHHRLFLHQFLSNWSWKFPFLSLLFVRIKVCTPLFLTLLQLPPTQIEQMETEAKNTTEKSQVRIPPKRGQVKVRIGGTLAKAVKTAASMAAKKVGCGESSASTAPLPGSHTSKQHSDTWPRWQLHLLACSLHNFLYYVSIRSPSSSSLVLV